jgi:tetratricopeptide (TPR) repeat protein
MERQAYAGTMPMVRHAVAMNGTSALTHEQKAAIHYCRGEKDKALEMYREAARLAPGDAAVQKAYADFVYVALGKPADALPLYKHVLDLKPGDTETLHILGNLSASQQRPDDARLYYNRLLGIEPWNMAAKKSLQALPAQPASDGTFKEAILSARQTVQSGEHDQVNATLDRLVELKREAMAVKPAAQREIPYDDIRRMASSGQLDQAIAALEQLIARTPDNALAHNDLGVLYTNAGKPEKALRHHRRAVELDPTTVTYRKNLADLLFVAEGDAEGALQAYVDILRNHPKDVETLGAIALICSSLGKTADARTFYDLILDIEPWNQAIRSQRDALANGASVEVSHERAQALAREGRTAEACEMLERFIATSPANALAHNDLGVLYYQMGDSARAQAEYEEAVRLDPENSDLKKNLAEFYSVAQGRHEDALRILVDVLRKQPRDAETLMSIGRVCEMTGRVNDAKDFFNKVLEVEPWNQSAREQLQRI